jgi:hypothetical protein
LGSTPRFGLSYPELTDAPNGPEQIKALAEDVDARLSRLYRVPAGQSRPTDEVGTSFLIWDDAANAAFRWDGSAWQPFPAATAGGGGGGGGGGTSLLSTVSATFAATATQSIPPNTDTVVAFGVEQAADPAVTRSTSGAGHKFTLSQTRLWIVAATIRFAAHSDTGGRTVELRAGATVLAKQGEGDPAEPAWTRSLSVPRKLPAGTVITVVVRHDADTALSLEPASGSYVHIDIAGV